MTTRTCVICKTAHSVDALLPLQAPNHELELAQAGGRRAWVCLRRTCLKSLSRQAGRAGRSLRQHSLRSPDLQLLARAEVWRRIHRSLKACMASGLIRSGPRQVQESPAHSLAVIVQSSRNLDAPRVEGFAGLLDSPHFFLPIEPSALGAEIGRGPRSVLGVQHGKPSKRLIRQLHQLVEVG